MSDLNPNPRLHPKSGSDAGASTTSIDLEANRNVHVGESSESGSKRVKTVRVERDMQEVTVEGYRTLGIISTFIAGVEAQCLGVAAIGGGKSGLFEAVNALLLAGILLSSFGAAMSLLSARWFHLLRENELVVLETRWECARKRLTKQKENEEMDKLYEKIGYKPECSLRSCIVAQAVGLTLPMVLLGFYVFIIGMVLYTWETRSIATAVVSTIIALMGTILALCMHLDFQTIETLKAMHFRRPRI